MDIVYLFIDNNKFVVTKTGNTFCSITIDPIMTKGVNRIELQFEGHESDNFNKTRTVRYQNNGELGIGQSTQGIIGNQMYKCGQIVSAEVDFEAVPHTLNFYVDDPEQPIYIRNVPKSIRFYVFVCQTGASFQIKRFETLIQATPRVQPPLRVVEYGKY
ncbi:MAG: hypothetical protein EZS28_009012 [Streblomastix strix]|uniref:SPRY domain-containing protein n=1 Tax=Streblomastix strix TaxID=222440 RepID=A0A5J4WKD2_9EUKA|nr:MAG: hypothetical protein EZS28_009012 [Streblomastix strix]